MCMIVCGCASTKDAPADPSPVRTALDPTAANERECKRRTASMAAQDRAINADPNKPGNWVGTGYPPNWRAGGSPCSPDRESASADRDLAITRARVKLEEDKPELAREALSQAFYYGAPRDASLQQLASAVAAALEKKATLDFAEGSPLGTFEGEATCVFSDSPMAREDPEGTEQTEPAFGFMFIGSNTLHVSCGMPPMEKEEYRDWVLVIALRMRTGVGQYKLIEARPLGSVTQMFGRDNLSTTFSLPPEALTEEHSAYFDVALVAAKKGKPPEPLAHNGFFWFDRPPQ